MSTLTEVLDAIVANPDDDATRRVYADALLERDEPQGELIHVQLDLERDGLSRTERIVRRRREQALANVERLDALRVLRLGRPRSILPVPRTPAKVLAEWPLVKRLELLELTTTTPAEELEARIAGAVLVRAD